MVAVDLPDPSPRDRWGIPLNEAIETIVDAVTVLEDYRTARKIVPHQVTGVLASTAFPIDVPTTPQGSVRYPVKLAAPVTRFRVHIRNYSYGDAAGYTGTVNLTGLWWGQGRYDLDGNLDGGFTATPTQINGAATLGGTTEWVSPWITVNATEGTDHLLSVGWTTPGSGAAAKIVANWTRHWRTTSAANASQTAPTLTGGDGGGPFDIWLECDIPAGTPVVAFVGDSITIGNMHNMSFPVRYGQLHETWPIVFGHFGGTLNDWKTNDARWTRYGALSVDAVLVMCGINDITVDATYADVRARLYDVIARIRTHVGSRVFVSTILPTNNSNTAGGRETVRTQFNDWIKAQMRLGIAGAVDLARSVANPTNPAALTVAYTDAGLHLSADGAVQVAAAIPHLT